MELVVLLLICSLVPTEAGYSTNSFLNLMFRPAGRSRSFKWAGMGKAYTPSYIPPRPVYIPKWLPGPKPEYIARWVPNTPAPSTSRFRASQKLNDATYGFGAPKKSTVVKGRKQGNGYNAAPSGQSKSSNIITSPVSLAVPPLQAALTKINSPPKAKSAIQIPKEQYSVTLGSSIKAPSANTNWLNSNNNELSDEVAHASNNYITSVEHPASFVGSPSNYNPQDIITASSMMFAGPVSNLVFDSLSGQKHQLSGFSAPRQHDIIRQSAPQSLISTVLSAPLSHYSVTNIDSQQDPAQSFIQPSNSNQQLLIVHPEQQHHNTDQSFVPPNELHQQEQEYPESELNLSGTDEYNEIYNEIPNFQPNAEAEQARNFHQEDNNLNVVDIEQSLNYKDIFTNHQFDNNQDSAIIVQGRPVPVEINTSNIFQNNVYPNEANDNQQNDNMKFHKEFLVGTSIQADPTLQSNVQPGVLQASFSQQVPNNNFGRLTGLHPSEPDFQSLGTENSALDTKTNEDIVYIIEPKEKTLERKKESNNFLSNIYSRPDDREGDGVATITVVLPPAVAPPLSPALSSARSRSILRSHSDIPLRSLNTPGANSPFERRSSRHTSRLNSRQLFSSGSPSHFRPSYRRLIERSRQASPRSLWFF